MVPSPCKGSIIGKEISTEINQKDKFEFIIKMKELIQKNNVFISMHGITHSGYGEFSRNIPLEKIIRAKKKLEYLFDTSVDTFTPPNNILSKRNYHKLCKAGFKTIISAFSNWPSERPFTYCYIDHFLRSSVLALSKKKRQRILKNLEYRGVKEYTSFIAYNKIDLDRIVYDISNSRPKPDQTIVIATHFWELWKSHPNQLINLPGLIRCKFQQ